MAVGRDREVCKGVGGFVRNEEPSSTLYDPSKCVNGVHRFEGLSNSGNRFPFWLVCHNKQRVCVYGNRDEAIKLLEKMRGNSEEMESNNEQ